MSSCVNDVIFRDRAHAGHLLAQQLSLYQKENPLVFGLARGGVVVAQAIAKELNLPLDVLVIKKIPSPVNPELGIGALAPNNIYYVNWKLAQRLGAEENFVESKIYKLTDQIKKKSLLYRGGKKPYKLHDKTVIIVDDGVATGATIEAAILWLRKKHTQRIIIAVPVSPLDFLIKIKYKADNIIALHTPQDFSAVGEFYKDFREVTDEEVVELLKDSKTVRQ